MATSFCRIVLLIVFSLFFLLSAKAQSFCWAQAINGISSINGIVVTIGTTDIEGNLYSVGAFGGTADFDRGAGVYNLTAVSDLDMFIMKESASGNLIWVKQVKGISSGVWGCVGHAIDVDGSGNIFITGTFRDSVDFDPGLPVYQLNSFGGYHTFILKIDPTGNFIWVKDIGTQVPSVGVSTNAARLDKNGYLYFAAIVSGDGTTPLDADPGTGIHNITSEPGDLLLEKLDSNGSFIWAKVISGDNNPRTPWSLSLDSASNIFISGKFLGSADFDPGPGVYTLTCTPGVPFGGATDIFVAKYDSAGNFNWAYSFGSSGDDAGIGGTVDHSGNVLVTGSFGGTVDFDPGPGTYNLTAASTRSLFILRLRNNGDFSWVKMGGTSSGTYSGVSVITDSAENVYTAMVLNGSCDLDPGAGVYDVPSGAAVQKLDSAGNYVWGAGFEADEPRWIGLDNKDSVYVCGDFTGYDMDFDPGPGAYLLSDSSDTRSGFILKLNQTPLPIGVDGVSKQIAVSVYPNPSLGIINFSSPGVIDRIEVTDIAGKIVYANEPAQTKTVIDLGGKAAGVYFYEVDCGDKKQRGKLVIY